MHVPYGAFRPEAHRPVRKLLYALFHPFREPLATDRTASSQLYGLLRREGNLTVSVTRPVVLSIRRIRFDGKFEAPIPFPYSINHLPIRQPLKLKHIGFPPDPPRPSAVTVAVRDQCESVEGAQSPVHGRV